MQSVRHLLSDACLQRAQVSGAERADTVDICWVMFGVHTHRTSTTVLFGCTGTLKKNQI